MRIIGGRFRSRTLLAPVGQKTRPTSDRLRETLMNVLTNGAKNRALDARMLDLYAGTGAVGMEALSRGAQSVTFVDQSSAAMTALEANCKRLGLGVESQCIRSSVCAWLRRAASPASLVTQRFDLVFLDPPWDDREEYEQALGLLGGEAAKLLAPNAWVIAEHRSKNVLAEDAGALRRWRVIKQGDATLSFYTRASQSDEPADELPSEAP